MMFLSSLNLLKGWVYVLGYLVRIKVNRYERGNISLIDERFLIR